MNLIPKKYYLDDFFDDFFPEKTVNSLKCDIYEKDNKYHIVMDIPGFSKEDINIDCDDNYLTISASKENNIDEEKANYIRKERIFGSYQRRFYIGDADSEKIDAEFKDGTLNIVIPKKEVIDNKKKIEIK
ncbi:MAG TPA: Hsp20/alpha crystallin family protein [Bacilli bacterium]|nr:Hsp20/alpha crystallin family protein [Bacilli bacterium]